MSPTVARRLISGLIVLCLTGACGKGNADEHVKKAEAFVEQRKPGEAIVEYRTAIEIEPQRGDIRVKLARLYESSGDVVNALKEYVRAADVLSTDATIQVSAGNMLLRANALEDAKARAEKAIALDPKNIDAQILLGNAQAGLNDLDSAVQRYQQALALDPTAEVAYRNLGMIQQIKKQGTTAEASFKKAIDVGPKSVDARLALANFYWSSGRRAEAEQAFKDALAIDPVNISANRALGSFYINSNRTTEAEPYFAAVAKASKDAAAKLGMADYYIFLKRYEDARKTLSPLLDNDATHGAATLRLATIYIAQGDRAAAAAKLEEVVIRNPKDMQARVVITRLHVLDGKQEQAFKEAKAIVTEEPTSTVAADAYMIIGGISADSDRPDEAIAAFKEVLKRQPQAFAAELALSDLYLSGDAVDLAATHGQQALTLQPKDPFARTEMARIFIKQHNLSRAKELAASLQKDFPNTPGALGLQGTIYAAEGQIEAARTAFTKALAIAPADLQSLTGLVQIEFKAGRSQDAVKRIDAALKAGRPSADFLILAADVYASVKDSTRAEEMLTRAITVAPSRLEAYGLLGALYVSEKRIGDARDQFQAMLTKDPKSIPASTMLAMLFDLEKKSAEAEKQYEKTLAIDPNAGVAANNLAWIYVSGNRNLDQAIQLAQTAQKELGDQATVSDTLGWAYFRKGMAPQAIQALEGAVLKAPNDPSFHYHLGMAYELNGDLEKARQSLTRALASKTEFEGIADARAMLAKIGR